MKVGHIKERVGCVIADISFGGGWKQERQYGKCRARPGRNTDEKSTQRGPVSASAGPGGSAESKAQQEHP